MAKYVVEFIHQFEIDTPNIRDLMLKYKEPTFPEALVTEVTKLTGKATYFKFDESEPLPISTCAGCLSDFDTDELTETMLCPSCVEARLPIGKN